MSKATKTNYSVCTICDIGCQLRPETEGGKLVAMKAHDNPALAKNVCYKGTAAPHIHNHEERIKKPLKRIGERGEDKWEEISYQQAMDEIAERLRLIVDKYGPESMVVSTSGWNTQTTHGLDRRFMNALGTPNYISGVSLCAGNTAAVNKLTYGWFVGADISNSKCVVLFGHNPRKHSWTPIYNQINAAKANGAKLIVLDPRVSDQAEHADMHLSLRAGTDAAMCLGWLNVIINEELYDKDFVAEHTTGFEELCDRVAEYPVARVAEITGVAEEQIIDAARLYATAESACIPWTPITDMQISSTSAIRLHSILRALTGNLDVPGGELLAGFNPSYISESEVANHDMLVEEQKAKQLGSDLHPAYTYRAQEMLSDATERVYGSRYADIVMGCYMANPSAVFRAMVTEQPYAVKAFFTLGNNSLMSYPNQNQILKGLMNQELIVAHEIFMTPTAMLADYILPGDVFSERNHIADSWNWRLGLTLSERVVEPPEEASSTFQFWRDLAHRMGFGNLFPWKSLEEMLDYRLSPSGMSFEEFSKKHYMYIEPPEFKKYKKVGFGTPSGKVELKSSILETLGYDPLPYYREGPAVDEDYPYYVFTGVREDPFFQTGQRQVKVLRDRCPAPHLFMHPADAKEQGIKDGDWAKLETPTGEVVAKVSIQESMKEKHVRVPHGWWYPEMRGKAELAGSFISSDAVLCPDQPEMLDHEQGIPHFKGFPGKVTRLAEAPTGLPDQVVNG